MIRKLKTWWFVWRRFGVTPWQYEADVAACKRFAELLIEGKRKGGA